MLREKEIRENNYNYYLIYRELGHKTVTVKGFRYLAEMIRFILDNEESIVILESLVTFK